MRRPAECSTPLRVSWPGTPPVAGDVLLSPSGRVAYRLRTVAELAPGELLLIVTRHTRPRPGPGGVVHAWSRTGCPVPPLPAQERAHAR